MDPRASSGSTCNTHHDNHRRTAAKNSLLIGLTCLSVIVITSLEQYAVRQKQHDSTLPWFSGSQSKEVPAAQLT